MKLVITKEQVIEALETETLQAGTFFNVETDYDKTTVKDYETCAVCAVGAVLRKCLGPEVVYDIEREVGLGEEVTRGKFMDFNTNELLLEGNYLGALSCEFEKLIEEDDSEPFNYGIPSERVVDDMIKWVKTTFPESFTVEF